MKAAQSRFANPLLGLVLLFLALLSGRYSVPMLASLQFSFQSLFPILAIRLLGRRHGILISLTVLTVQWLFWDGTAFHTLYFLEILFLALHRGRMRDRMLLRDLIFWILIGAPLLYVMAYAEGQVSLTDMVLLTTLPVLNGMANTLLSELATTYLLPDFVPQKAEPRRGDIPFQSLLFHLSATGMLGAFILILVITGQYLDRTMHQRAYQFSHSLSSGIRDDLNEWTLEDDRMLRLHADLQAGRLEQLVLAKQSGSARILILDETGYIYADTRQASAEERWEWPDGQYYRYNDKLWLALSPDNSLYELSRWNKALYYLDDPVEIRSSLHILVIVPAHEYLSDVKSIYSLILGFSLLFILLVLMGNLFLGRMIQRVMNGLVEATSGLPARLSQGGDTHVISKGRIVEFNRLTDNFNEMSVELGDMLREREHMNKLLQEQTAKLQQSEGQFRQMAFSDPLTGLPNRLYFTQYLNSLRDLPAQSVPELTLLFLDLDRFKHINDTYGHDAGDAVLIHAARVLREACRTGFVCRIAGDEFVAVLENAPLLQTEAAAQAILDGFRAPVRFKDADLPLGTSIGIAVSPADTGDPGRLVQLADQAMYRAKQLGGSRFVWYAKIREKEESE
ncbi:diguanylate cyclase [Paenibacillus spiritus]|uniref:Diguanylate cyclase n=1 Tax=Paenibacillus spiritus TaxID=2496557 RepID=A0A5J5G0C1_9BACL|nr:MULTISPECIES: GGDEF domain-containing protein [Paenibacillus]KAA8999774.1 diguanylate cyclase [Paenibacillus spiritus]